MKYTSEEIAKSYKAFFKTPQGRIVLWDLQETYCNDIVVSGDPVKTYGKACQQEVVRAIEMNCNIEVDDE